MRNDAKQLNGMQPKSGNYLTENMFIPSIGVAVALSARVILEFITNHNALR